MPLTDIFKRPSRRESQIDAAEREAYTGKPAPKPAPKPVKANAAAEVEAAQAKAWGTPRALPKKKFK